MTTAAQVRSAWLTNIFQNASITALTDKIYDYDVTLETTKEFSKLRYRQEINFMLYLVTVAQRVMMMGQYEQAFTVEIRYGKQADVAGTVFKAVADVFETIQTLVQTNLTGSWGSTVDYYRIQNGPPNIVQQEIENIPIWIGTLKYTGFKYTG